MTGVPADPQIYHITHVGNLSAIIESGSLASDAMRISGGAHCSQLVGIPDIKQDRLAKAVTCHPGTCVGEYKASTYPSTSVRVL